MEVTVSTNDVDNYLDSELLYLTNTIHKMNTFHHVEIYKIFMKYPQVTLNENNSGTHINLSVTPKETLDEISNYVNYALAQENNLNIAEKQKNEYKNTYFNS